MDHIKVHDLISLVYLKMYKEKAYLPSTNHCV